MVKNLAGKKIAILVDNYFEEAEMTGPKHAVEEAGAKVDLIAAESIDGKVQGLKNLEKGSTYKIDKTLEEANIEDYDALILPGGAINSDKLRIQDKAKQWTVTMVDKGKPLAVICHAPWLLVSAGLVKGRRLTSFPTIRDDLENAGAKWLDEEVVIDGTIVTSRKPADIPAFNKALLSLL
jgi:protease I